jgi:hypothetical protein
MARKSLKPKKAPAPPKVAPPKAAAQSGAFPIQEDLRCQEVTWAVERAGWAVMALIVVAALAGLFGGSMTRDESKDPSGRLHVSYQHYQRHLDPTDMTLSVETQGQSLFEITIDATLAASFEIRSITPQPIESQAHEGGLLLKFAASPDSGAPARIRITGVPTGAGSVAGNIGLIGESSGAPLDIFVYP